MVHALSIKVKLELPCRLVIMGVGEGESANLGWVGGCGGGRSAVFPARTPPGGGGGEDRIRGSPTPTRPPGS